MEKTKLMPGRIMVMLVCTGAVSYTHLDVYKRQFIYCDAPFIDKNQIYILMRCKIKLWIIGQIIYIFMTSAMYFSLIAAMTIVLNIRNIEYMND